MLKEVHNVLSVVLRHASNGIDYILLVVRRPEFNMRHPGMVSMPTMRIPKSINLESTQAELAKGQGESFGSAGAGSSTVSFLVETIISRKLEAAGYLEDGTLGGACALRIITEGIVEDPLGTTLCERTRMYTVEVELTRGWERIPGRLTSYSYIKWVDVSSFRAAWHRRDGQMLFPTANPFEICIGGLCIRSAMQLLDSAPMYRESSTYCRPAVLTSLREFR